MRNELQKFNETVDILVKAYLNDTLEHTNCYACAVGNLVAHANKCTYKKGKLSGDLVAWKDGSIFPMDWFNPICAGIVIEEAIEDCSLKEAESIGYSLDEIAKIEYAFENCSRGNNADEYMLNGLMNVVEVLAEIHKVDLSIKESAKALFVKC